MHQYLLLFAPKKNCTMLFYKLWNPFVAFFYRAPYCTEKNHIRQGIFIQLLFHTLPRENLRKKEIIFQPLLYSNHNFSFALSHQYLSSPTKYCLRIQILKKTYLASLPPFPASAAAQKYAPKKTSTPRFPKIRIRSAHRKKTKIRKKCSQLR